MDTPFFEKQHLFEARSNGYNNFRIPSIVSLSNGTILAYCEARLGTGSDWDLIDIQMRRSLDGGSTWEDAHTIVDHRDFDGGGINNFVLIPDPQTGDVHAVFCRAYESVFYMKSSDDGQSFSSAKNITDVLDKFRSEYNWKVCATGPGHGIALSSGRLLVPVWLSTAESENRHRPSLVSVIYSDNHGEIWQRGEIIAYHNDHIATLSETVAVELSNQSVLVNIRNESPECRRLVSISPDGSHDWTPVEFDDALLEPQCMGSILRLKTTQSNIAFVNPNNLDQTLPGARGYFHDRKRLTIRISNDDCQSWSQSRVIEANASGYSDLAENADGHILCFYEDDYIDRMSSTKFLTLARFNLTWIYESE